MTTGTRTKPSTDQRTCQRIAFSRQVMLETAHGIQLEGETRDTSLGGLLIHIRNPSSLDHLSPGMDVSLYLSGHHTSARAFPCRVVRIEQGMVALELDRKSAPAFGLQLTRNLFRRGA